MTTEIFSTPGTYTWVCPAGVSSLYVELWGGGGSAGRKSTSDSHGAGAGGGGMNYGTITVTPGQSYPFTVGAGGIGTINGSRGNFGSASTFNNAYAANGGNYGPAPTGRANVSSAYTTIQGPGTAALPIAYGFPNALSGGRGGTATINAPGGGGGGGGGFGDGVGATTSTPSPAGGYGYGQASALTGRILLPGRGGQGGSFSSGESGGWPGGGGGGVGGGTAALDGGNGGDGAVVLVYTSDADTTPPAIPVASVTKSGSTVNVTWNSNSDVELYEVFRDGGSITTTTDNFFSQTVSDGSYSYTVRARDAAGNWSDPSPTVYITVDTTAPTLPVISGSATGSTITLSWNTNSDVVQYELYRNGVFIGVSSTTTFSEVLPDGTYSYTLRARDVEGNWTAQSAAVVVTVDTTPPAVPSPSVSVSGTSVQVSWSTVSTATLYEIFKGGVSQGTTSSTTFSHTQPEGTYSYTVRARDAAGNWSAQSAPTSVTVDVTPPAVPYLSVTSSGNSVTASWAAVPTATVYEVFRGGVSQGTTTSMSLIQTVTDGIYDYTVRARDAAGNWSAQSSPASVTVDTTPPAVPAAPTVTVADPPSRSTTVSWSAMPTATIYEVYLNGVSTGTTSQSSLNIGNLSDGSHSVTVRARDAAGNWSALSAATVTMVDRTPPAAPLPPTLSQQNLNSKDINISWYSVTDATRYGIFRNGVKITTVATTSYKDTVTQDDVFRYSISAIDSSDNESFPSSESSIRVASAPQLRGLHAPEAVRTDNPEALDYTVDQRKFPGEDNIRFDRP